MRKLILIVCLTWSALPAFAYQMRFDFHLSQPSPKTSVAVVNSQGDVVRVLSTLENLPAGDYSRIWDGFDERGFPVPPDTYKARLYISHSELKLIGATSNSEQGLENPRHGAVDGILGIANFKTPAGDTGYIEARVWAEGSYGLIKRDSQGNFVGGHFSNGYTAAVCDDHYVYLGAFALGATPQYALHSHYIRRFDLGLVEKPFSGTTFGTITVDNGDADLPGNASDEDKHNTLRSLAVDTQSLYVADNIGNRLLQYKKDTGVFVRQINVTLPRALAIDPIGRLWVAHSGNHLSIFNSDGSLNRADVIASGPNIQSLAFNPAGQLAVAFDSQSVSVYDISGATLNPVKSFGAPASPGDEAADHFFNISQIDFDSDGNLMTLDVTPIGPNKPITKFSGITSTVLFRHWCTDFVTAGTINPNNPTSLWSPTFNHSRITDKANGSSIYLSNVYNDTRNWVASGFAGTPRIVRILGNDYFFLPGGEFVTLRAYRIENDKTLHMTSLLCTGWPDKTVASPGRFISWSDINGTGEPAIGEVTTYALGPDHPSIWANTASIDYQGNLLFPATAKSAGYVEGVFEIPYSLDARNNPFYDWKKHKQLIAQDTSDFHFIPEIVTRAPDQSITAIEQSAYWKRDNLIYYRTGTALARYDANGVMRSVVRLPEDGAALEALVRPDGTGFQYDGDVVGELSGNIDYFVNNVRVDTIKAVNSANLDGPGTMTVTYDADAGAYMIFAEEAFYERNLWYSLKPNVTSMDVPGTMTSSNPSVQVQSPEASAYEQEQQSVSFIFTRTGDTSRALSINVEVSGTAIPGAQYRALPNPVVIPAGQDKVFVPVVPIKDQSPSDHARVHVKILPSSGYDLSTNTDGDIDIRDTNWTVVSMRTINPLAARNPRVGSAASAPAVIEARRTGATYDDLYVAYNTNGSTAGYGLDYDVFGGNYGGHIRIPAGSSVGYGYIYPRIDRPLTATNNTVQLNVETYMQKATQLPMYIVGTPSVAQATIIENAATVKPLFSLAVTDNSAGAREVNGVALADPARIRVTQCQPEITTPSTVLLGTFGTFGPDDIVPIPASVVVDGYPNGCRYGTLVDITPKNYRMSEGIKTVGIREIPDDSYNLALVQPAEVTLGKLTDPQVNIEPIQTAAFEKGNLPASFILSRTGDLSTALPVTLSETGTALNRVSGSNADYDRFVDGVEMLTSVATIPAGKSSVVVSIKPRSDTRIEGTEYVTFALVYDLTHYSSGNSLIKIFIYDEQKPEIRVTPEIPSTTRSSAAPARFKVDRLGNAAGALTVNLAFAGTALAGVHYAPPPTSVVIPDGAAEAFVDITPVSTGVYPGDKTVVMTVSPGDGYDATGVSNNATITIVDDVPDTTPPTVRFVSPSDGAQLTGPTELVMQAADDSLVIDRIELSLDGLPITTLIKTPYVFNWDTRVNRDGEHTLAAKAFDLAGNFAVSERKFVLYNGNVPRQDTLDRQVISKPGGDVAYSFFCDQAGPAIVTILNRLGQQVQRIQYDAVVGQQSLVISTKYLGSGVYYLKNDHTRHPAKIVVVH